MVNSRANNSWEQHLLFPSMNATFWLLITSQTKMIKKEMVSFCFIYQKTGAMSELPPQKKKHGKIQSKIHVWLVVTTHLRDVGQNGFMFRE